MTAAHRKASVLLESMIESPLGALRLLSLDDAVCWLGFDDGDEHADYSKWRQRYLSSYDFFPAGDAHKALHDQIHRYFYGMIQRFKVKTQLFGTDFQLQVWTALRSIAYGTTSSYSAVAEAIGNPKASRAVGQAVGRNPLSIIIPCHRVVGEDGSLVGYGGGIDRKRQLLKLEGALLV
jgi:methylated-DNA-[protein]-cysteine S-methyltransferase